MFCHVISQAELRQENYAVEVAASSTARRRLTSPSSPRRTIRAMAESDSYCSNLAQEMKENVVEFLSSHKRFVRFLEDKDLSKKCRKEYMSNAIGVMRNEDLFDKECKLTIKMNAKLELLNSYPAKVSYMTPNFNDLRSRLNSSSTF